MPLNRCAPCSDQCLAGYATHEVTFRHAVLNILCSVLEGVSPTVSVGRMNGNYNGSDQQIIATPGAGYKIIIRSLFVNTEDSNTDFQFKSKIGVSASVALSPNYDFLSNAGAVLNYNPDGWFELPENAALVVTTNNPVDVIGTYKVVPA